MFEPRAYAIEDAVFDGKFRHLRFRQNGMTVADQRAIVRKIVDRVPGMVMPTVVRRRGALNLDSWARPKENKIWMGPMAGPAMVCHEVAHLMTPRDDNSTPAHSREWESAYVTCVAIAISEYHAKRLAKAFEKARKVASDRVASRRRVR